MTQAAVQQRSGLRRRRVRRGSVILETALVVAFIMLPFLLGMVVAGFSLLRLLQVNQINRDAGHMYARGVDFTPTNGVSSRNILYQMSSWLQNVSGNGAMILTQIQFVGPVTCGTCTNSGKPVFLQQITIGNPNLIMRSGSTFKSVYGSPQGAHNADGVTLTNPYSDANNVVLSPASPKDIVTTLGWTLAGPNGQSSDGQLAFVAETYYSSTDLAIPGFVTQPGVYARAIF